MHKNAHEKDYVQCNNDVIINKFVLIIKNDSRQPVFLTAYFSYYFLLKNNVFIMTIRSRIIKWI
jgi:hypothetical protein